MDAVALLREAIALNLRNRTWRAGHRIPTERELAAQHGMARSTVRRVLAEFKARGLITQTVGSGTYVSEQAAQILAAAGAGAPDSAPDGLPDLHQALNQTLNQTISPAELMSARCVLEPALIDMVIGNATAADFARMDECNTHAEAATTLDDFEHWDAALHEAIADAAHNGFMSSVFRLMNQVRAQSEWGVLKRRSATPERRVEYQAEHRDLVAALKERDAARARALCMGHLLHVRHNMLGY